MPNYILLEKITVGAAGAASVTFSGIPQTGYTDLVVKASIRDSGSSDVRLRFNGNTSSIYTERRLYGNGASTGSDTITQTSMYFGSMSVPTTFTANTFSNMEIYIPNYTSSANKSLSTDGVTENNATTSYATLHAGLFADTTAISSINIFPDSGSFQQYSTFYLYGVAKLGTTPAIVPYATGGDTIMTDGTYWYHTFTSSGTFTPQKSLSCDLLVVAGGGGGGYYNGSGGGGGGLLEQTGRSLSATAYTVTIGGGGAKSPAVAVDNVASSGSNSVFDTSTALGGGGGNGGVPGTNSTSTAGGSSGGKQAGSASAATQGNSGGATGYGNAGAVYNFGAGGGGAGAAGSVANGGNGRANSISGTSVTYAGGGGGQGGTNGTGGGSTANFGGGGKGDTENGGSGIVIVRYAV